MWKMANVVGVRYKKAGRMYYFDPAGLELAAGDRVVVDTNRGPALGQVILAPTEVLDSEVEQPLKPVVRRATPDDLQRAAGLPGAEQAALAETDQLVAKLGLPMKLVSAEYNLDSSHLTVYFTAENRVDFRELVRELSHRLKVRVELRQIGPRDETKIVGGYGRCGRELCCARFLTDFAPVSIKMAKEQNLPLNPQKISGACGRLLCCMGYEYETYREMRANMPREGQRVQTPLGKGTVVGGLPLEEMVRVELDSGTGAEVPLKDVVLDKSPVPEAGPPASEKY